MRSKIVSSLQKLAEIKYALVRVLSGTFAFYFFFCYFESLDFFFSFRNKTTPNWINSALNQLGNEGSIQLLQLLLVLLSVASVLFVFGKWTRITAALIWIGYTFFYNFYICINQPHITYFIFILITYIFLSNEPILSKSSKPSFEHKKFFWLLISVYMLQMTISGFSKSLSMEWLSGDVLRILSQVRDPEPGVVLIGALPDWCLRILTWFTLVIECFSFLYLILPASRRFIWTSHLILYCGIILFVPHAKHVAWVMILFNLLIFDSSIFSKTHSRCRI